MTSVPAHVRGQGARRGECCAATLVLARVRPVTDALRVYVGYLRRKLELLGARPLIGTVHGVGYVLREP